MTDPGSTPRRLLALVPSQRRGGGIEAYVDAVVDACRRRGHRVEVLALSTPECVQPSVWTKLRYAGKALYAAVAGPQDFDAVVAFHPAFIPVAALIDIARRNGGEAPMVLFHGNDIWSLPRWQRWALRRRRLPVLTVSSFSAGALVGAGLGVARLIPPALSADRFELLRSVARCRPAVDVSTPAVLSVFRLEDAPGKGGEVLVEAAGRLRGRWPGLSLVLAGRGPIPEALRAMGSSRPWLQVVESPTDAELAELYRRACLFVLATRTRAGRRCAYGEGFGIVLAEAQLAGVPVVGPASGGSGDAFVDRYTGRRVSDESPGALAAVMAEMLESATVLASYGAHAADWAKLTFDPVAFGSRLEQTLFGAPSRGQRRRSPGATEAGNGSSTTSSSSGWADADST